MIDVLTQGLLMNVYVMPPSLATLHPCFIFCWHKHGLSRFHWTPILCLFSENWCVHYTANTLALLIGTAHSGHICSYIKTMSEPSLLTNRQSSQSKMYTASVPSLNLHHHVHICPFGSLSPTGNVVVHSSLCCMHTHTQLFDSDAWRIMHGNVLVPDKTARAKVMLQTRK